MSVHECLYGSASTLGNLEKKIKAYFDGLEKMIWDTWNLQCVV